jgi:transcriptional regulator with XRE-family HTH domain
MKSIGERIKFLRNLSGLSQEDLAETLEIDRGTLSNIERNERELKAEEVRLFSETLNISANQLLGIDPLPEVTLEPNLINQTNKEHISLRINVPSKNVQKFKEVLLYILGKVGAKPNVGETVIYKILYFIDFNHYEQFEEQLIGATYIKSPFGPTPAEFNLIIKEMIKESEIEKISSTYFKKEQKKYLPRREANLTIFSGIEIKTIDEVLDRLSDMNATSISAYSHEDIPWIVTPNGAPINYETVFYRTPAYSMRSNDNNIQNPN